MSHEVFADYTLDPDQSWLAMCESDLHVRGHVVEVVTQCGEDTLVFLSECRVVFFHYDTLNGIKPATVAQHVNFPPLSG